LALVALLLLSLLLAACGDPTATTAPAATTAAAATTTAAATASASGKKVVVASKDFPESFIVAEMYATALENAGIPVERKMNLGTVAIVQAAIVKGDVSLYPEYTGTGAGAVLKLQNPPNEPKQLYDLVNSEYQKQFSLTWLDVAPHSNRNGIAVTKAAADKYKLKNLSDLAPVAKELRFASNPEFIGDRSAIDGLKSLQKTYGGFDFKETKQVDIKLRYKALVDGQADACVAFGTDGELAGYGLVWLEDDKNNFGPYQTGPVVRNDILAAYPKIKDILNPITAKLTTEKISALNWSVSGPDKKEPADVAKAFLKTEGLIK
jgi:osmoprotectant transport system substrate-binding protein